jgi:hypothetical protein
MEIRKRSDVEHDWGTATVGNTDTGRLRAGAARAFVGTSDPATLGQADYLGSNVLDDGRLEYNTTTGLFRVQSAGAWVTVGFSTPDVRDTQASTAGTAFPAGLTTVAPAGPPGAGLLRVAPQPTGGPAACALVVPERRAGPNRCANLVTRMLASFF